MRGCRGPGPTGSREGAERGEGRPGLGGGAAAGARGGGPRYCPPPAFVQDIEVMNGPSQKIFWDFPKHCHPGSLLAPTARFPQKLTPHHPKIFHHGTPTQEKPNEPQPDPNQTQKSTEAGIPIRITEPPRAQSAHSPTIPLDNPHDRKQNPPGNTTHPPRRITTSLPGWLADPTGFRSWVWVSLRATRECPAPHKGWKVRLVS